jgi:hypothetical protein
MAPYNNIEGGGEKGVGGGTRILDSLGAYNGCL